jgi:hypothetical protein
MLQSALPTDALSHKLAVRGDERTRGVEVAVVIIETRYDTFEILTSSSTLMTV